MKSELRKNYCSLYWLHIECEEKAFKCLSSEKFLKFWDADLSGDCVRINPRFHAGIDDGYSALEYSISEFIQELGKRIFRNKFPEDLKGQATALWYSF